MIGLALYSCTDKDPDNTEVVNDTFVNVIEQPVVEGSNNSEQQEIFYSDIDDEVQILIAPMSIENE